MMSSSCSGFGDRSPLSPVILDIGGVNADGRGSVYLHLVPAGSRGLCSSSSVAFPAGLGATATSSLGKKREVPVVDLPDEVFLGWKDKTLLILTRVNRSYAVDGLVGLRMINVVVL